MSVEVKNTSFLNSKFLHGLKQVQVHVFEAGAFGAVWVPYSNGFGTLMTIHPKNGKGSILGAGRGIPAPFYQ